MPHEHVVRRTVNLPAWVGPATGMVGQVAALFALAASLGLGAGGWFAGLAVGAVTCAALWRTGALTPADRVTLARVILVGAVTALVVDGLSRPVPTGALVTLASVALALDFVDGRIARTTGQVTARGARFDMETDSLLVLVLSIHVGMQIGTWVFAIGAMRYAAWLAGALAAPLRRRLPPRYWRKVVAAIQGVTLTVAAAHLVPAAVAGAALALALLLLLESFGRDAWWQLTGAGFATARPDGATPP